MRKLFSVVMVAGLVLAACGSDDDDVTSPSGDSADVTTTEAGGTATTAAADDSATTVAGDASATTTPGATGTTVGDVVPENCTADTVGGELRISPRGVGRTLDAYTNGGSNILTSWETIPTNPPLMYFDTVAAEYKPYIAESLTPNDDSSVWTLKLREEVEFGNGDPLNAEAVIAHIDRHLAADSTSRLRTTAATQIASYTAIDDYTVEFVLNGPFGAFPSTLTVGLGQIDNMNVVNERGEGYATDNTGGGVGAYEITKFAPPEPTILTAKEDWWGGPVCFETIVINTIPDMGAAYDAYKQDEIDILSFNRDPVLLNSAIADGIGNSSGQVNNGAFFMMPNVGTAGYEGPFTDLRVRMAAAYAIDPEVVNARAWGGEGLAGKGLVNNASNLLNGTEGIPYDPAKATELLDEYKAETGWDGTIDAIAAGTPASNKEAAIAVAAMLDAVGFKTNLSADLPVFDLITKVAFERDFELVASWGMIQSEPTLANGLRAWNSMNPANQNGFSSPTYDAALAAVDAAVGLDEYQAALEALQIVINEEVPFIPYGADPTTTLYNDNVLGLRWHDGITPLVDFAFLQK